MSILGTAVLRPASSSATDELRFTLERQRAAFLQAGPPPLAERLADLARLKAAIRDQAEAIAQVISADFGNRSRHETLLAEIFTALAGIRHATRASGALDAARSASRSSSELLPGRARILYQPLGVVGIISPWNYPFQLAIMPLIAALAAGNRIMLKPSELTPRTVGFASPSCSPASSPASRSRPSSAGRISAPPFARLPFDHLFYTGSTAVGRLVMQAAAENLTPVTLELGGKSPCILGEDATLQGRGREHRLRQAAERRPDLHRARLRAGARGQARGVHRAGAAARCGNSIPRSRPIPTTPASSTTASTTACASMLDEAKAERRAHRRAQPGARSRSTPSRKLAPTLVIEPAEDLALMREEIFGPVLPVRTYRELDEAIDFVNRRPRPLALYYFGEDAGKRDRVLARTSPAAPRSTRR